MSGRVHTHDFSQYVLTIGGQIIGGYGSDGGVEYEWADDIGEDEIDADGKEVTFSRSNDKRCYANITLRQSSSGYKRLMSLLTTQDAQKPEILPLPFEGFNPATGERVSSSFTIFKSRPQPSEQKGVQDRTIQVLLPHAQHIVPPPA